MNKTEIKKRCNEIEEIIRNWISDEEEQEQVLEHLRAIRGEPPMVRISISELDLDILDWADCNNELSDYYFKSNKGWVFLGNEKSLNLVEKIVRHSAEAFINELKKGYEEGFKNS